MPYQDTFFSTTFQLLNPPLGAPPGSPGTPMDITGASFELWITTIDANGLPVEPPLFQLSTDPGEGLTITNANAGLLQMILTKAQTAALPLGTMAFDVMRTDQVDPISGNPEPQRYFGGFMYVKKPATQL